MKYSIIMILIEVVVLIEKRVIFYNNFKSTTIF
jgi:hypothetical protein